MIELLHTQHCYEGKWEILTYVLINNRTISSGQVCDVYCTEKEWLEGIHEFNI